LIVPKRIIYLDHLSTTPVDPRVLKEMQPFFTKMFGNASSPHRLGLEVRDALSRAREQCALLINAESPDEIIVTSSGTEANNLAIKGTALANRKLGNHIVYCETDHPSVLESISFLEKNGFTTTKMGVDSQGFLNPEDIRKAITDQTILVSVHLVNHDIGTIQPIKEISKITTKEGVPLFCDGTASVGLMDVDVQALGIDLLSFSPHRFHGPKGVGVLYRNRKARMDPIIHGGVQESGKRAGVENIPAIVGCGFASEFAREELPRRMEHFEKLQKQLWKELKKHIPTATLNGPSIGSKRAPYHLSLAFESIEGESLSILLDHHGFCVASGASCISKALKTSHVLKAIGLSHEKALSTILVTLGKDNTVQEIRDFVATVSKVLPQIKL
jgi:cysteine desulfurase